MANERLLFYRCSQRGSPSVLGQGEDGRHYVVPSRPVFFQTCPATRRQGQVPHRPRGEMSHSSRPAVPRSPRQSPAVSASHPQSPYSLVLTVTGDHSLLSCSFCVLFFYALVLYLLLPYCFISLWCFSLSLDFPSRNPVWIDGTGDGNPTYGCHGYWGCASTGTKGFVRCPFFRQKWTFLNKQFSTLLIYKHLKYFHQLGNHYLLKPLRVEV